jgi:uncharacterized membrane protein (DUF106 family)
MFYFISLTIVIGSLYFFHMILKLNILETAANDEYQKRGRNPGKAKNHKVLKDLKDFQERELMSESFFLKRVLFTGIAFFYMFLPLIGAYKLSPEIDNSLFMSLLTLDFLNKESSSDTIIWVIMSIFGLTTGYMCWYSSIAMRNTRKDN